MKEEPGMSAFERKRLENIAANKAILTDISTTAKKIIPDRPKSTPKKAVKRESSQRTRVQPSRTQPTRMSSRLAGLDADNDTLKRKLEVEAEAQAEKDKAKKLRVAGDLSIADIVVDGKKYGDSVNGFNGIFRGAEPGFRTFTEDDVKETTSRELKELRESMSALELYDQWLPNDIKIVPQRAYAMGFHPMEDKPVIFAGDKEGAIGVFDASQKAEKVEGDDEDEEAEVSDPVISAFKVHTRTITSITFSLTDSNTVYTSSYDSSIRKMDLEKGLSSQLFAPSDINDDMPISAVDVGHTDPNVLYYSTLQGQVGRCDVRAPTSDDLWTLSDHKIGGFSLHPLQPHLLATASLDRHMKIWDLRNITGKGDLRHPALLGEHESRLSVSHAAWSAGGHVATSSYDDTIKIYKFPNAASWKAGHDLSEKDMEPAHRIPHNNQTGRWVTILKPQWQKRPVDGIQKFVIGNMNRFVDVYASDGSQLAQLGGEGITAVPAVAQFHPTQNWVAGVNASGKLCFWK